MREGRAARRLSKRTVETGKSVLIVLLIALGAILGAETGLFSEVYQSVGVLRAAGSIFAQPPDAGFGEREASPYPEAARPLAMAVTQADGSRRGFQYTAGVWEAYDKFKVILGEALGSAREPERVAAGEWEAALGGGGIYFDYFFNQPLSALAEWLGGGQIQGEMARHGARRFLLSCQEDGVGLYYIREPGGEFYRASTPISYFSLAALLPEYTANGAAFEYENPGDRGIDPYFLFMNELPGIPSFESGEARLNVLDELLPLFGMNRYVAERIPVSGGEEFIENDMRLEVNQDGFIRFRGGAPTAADGSEPMSELEAVNTALGIASACLRPAEGRDALQLSSLKYDAGAMEYTVTLTYLLNGLPVIYARAGSAAEIRLKNGAVASAVLYAREYSPIDGRYERVLPEELGVVSLTGSGEPRLAYKDRGDAVAAAWYLN